MANTKIRLLGLAAMLALAGCGGATGEGGASSEEDSVSEISSESSDTPIESDSSDSPEETSSSTSSVIQTVYEVGDMTFELDDSGEFLILTQVTPGSETLEIPESINGIPVKEIASGLALTENTTVKTLIVPDSVETIGSLAFSIFTALEEMTLPFIGQTIESTTATMSYLFGGTGYGVNSLYVPDTLTKITVTKGDANERCFWGLTSLQSVSIGGSTIREYAFYGCTGLTEVIFTGEVTEIQSYAFQACTSLVDFDLPSTLVTLESYALWNTALTSLTIPAGLNEFVFHNEIPTLASIGVAEGNETYASVDGVLFTKDLSTIVTYPRAKEGTTYDIPDGTTVIGDRAFYNTTYLEEVDLAGITSIGTQAFYNGSIKRVSLPTTCTEIGRTAFSTLTLESFEFAETLEGADELTLNPFFMSSTTGLTSITFPEYVKEIPDYALSGCETLTEINIEGTLRRIGYVAFASTSITTLTVTLERDATIGERIFNNCPYLTTFYIKLADGGTGYPTFEDETGFGSNVPSIVVEDQETADGLSEAWSQYASYISTESTDFVIEDGILEAYNGTDGTVVIPDGVTGIAAQAFSNSGIIEHITVPSSVETIGYRAFYYCESLVSVTFEHESFEDFSLLNSSGTAVTNGFSNVFTGIYPAYLFQSEDAKASFITATGAGVLYQRTFYIESETKIEGNEVYSADGTSLLKSITGAAEYAVEDGVTEIGAYAFYNDETLTSIDFNGVETIGNYAFNKAGLTSLFLGEKIGSIGSSAFSDCESLETVVIEGPAEIGSSAFAECESIDAFDFGDNTVSIGNAAFTNAFDGLNSVILPASMENIAESAFEDSGASTAYCCFSEEYASNTFDDGTAFADYINAIYDYVPE